MLDHADYTAPTRQHAVDHTDQEYIFPEKSFVDRYVGICDLSGVCTSFFFLGGGFLKTFLYSGTFVQRSVLYIYGFFPTAKNDPVLRVLASSIYVPKHESARSKWVNPLEHKRPI